MRNCYSSLKALQKYLYYIGNFVKSKFKNNSASESLSFSFVCVSSLVMVKGKTHDDMYW